MIDSIIFDEFICRCKLTDMRGMPFGKKGIHTDFAHSFKIKYQEERINNLSFLIGNIRKSTTIKLTQSLKFEQIFAFQEQKLVWRI